MKKILMGTLVLCIATFGFAQKQQQTVSIVPLPNSVQIQQGSFKINSKTRIAFDSKEDKRIAELFSDFIKTNYGLNLSIAAKPSGSDLIYFSSAKAKDLNNKEAYLINITPQVAEIIGNGAGLFYGFQSLIQLLPVNKASNEIQLNAVKIQDEPRFQYRGMHLDVGRHMFPVSFIKKYIDILAAYKLNTFHWHLTEDQGWRIEIKKYPKLTEIGGYRNQTLIGNYKADGDYDNTRYGGFYTQEEAKEVVAYAKDRYITVIPEIELPGHALAALSAYPELGCGEKPGPYTAAQTWGVFDDVFCAGKDETFYFLQDVLDEVITIFPSEYIHIGGDECPKTKWKTCPYCQKRMKDNKLSDEHALQSYFIQRIEKYINSKGRRIIGWDEILEGGLAPNATVMSWRGDEGGIAAAEQGHDVIITANSYGLYFDHKQGADMNREPLSIGGLSTLEKVYNADPMPQKLSADKQKHIIGVQANVWTEYIETPKKVEFTILPRILALSEIAWTKKEHKNWKNFSQERAANQLAKIDQTATVYRVPEVYGLKDTIIYASEYTFKDLKPSVEGAKIYYTIDNYDPSDVDQEYKDAVKVSVPAGKERTFKAIVITPSGRKSNYVKAVIINSKK
ncbi:Beta-hexosaminidase [Sphingobacterium spiritivorum]|uniref:beta-N-acetylhexosaminidase n=1 Tax=Sphingobacterium spiritivorum TaxID=258 RepID=A0A380BWI5_SPHSI|nr:family 20 glycosylhydrolase [Sphingobacterium spiritivorum]SUJ07927.1 Beta-hexosaminidase [Sphingobacterium spiritivorum]